MKKEAITETGLMNKTKEQLIEIILRKDAREVELNSQIRDLKLSLENVAIEKQRAENEMETWKNQAGSYEKELEAKYEEIDKLTLLMNYRTKFYKNGSLLWFIFTVIVMATFILISV